MHRLSLRAPLTADTGVPIPHEIHAQLLIRPLPRNMHPIHNQKRREQRVRTLSEKYPIHPSTAYVDAAEYRHHDTYAVTALYDPNTPPINSLTVCTRNPATPEEAAIALALAHRPTPAIIISDSKTAIKNFAKGTISPQALKILVQNPPNTEVELIWTPAHTRLGGNEAVNQAARELTTRAGPSLVPLHGARSARDSLLSYQEITAHYRLSRRMYPPAHRDLTNAEERLWRLLQANTLPCRSILHHIHPNLYLSPNCPACSAKDTVAHLIWACSEDPFPLIPSEELWEKALGSSDLQTQKSLAERAAVVTGRLRLSVTERT